MGAKRRIVLAGLAAGALGVGGVAFAASPHPLADSGATGDSGPVATGPRPAPIIYRPAGLSMSQPVPLVVALHASGDSPANFESYSRLNPVADANGFVVAYLGSPPPAWKDVSLNLPYVSSEISSIEQSENIDPTRVFVTGFSAGATMSFHIGCGLSKQVDAIAAVSGAMYRTGEPCALSHPVSELLIVGTNDIIPFAGSAILLPIPQVVQTWTTQDGCGSHSSSTTTGAVTEETFSACNEHTGVALYTIQGGVHTWPGPGAPGSDAQLSAAQAVWAFFSQHPGESVTRVAASLSSLRELSRGRVVATLDTGEPVRGRATVAIDGTVVAHRSLSLPRGAQVRLTLNVPSGRHGHGSLRLALSDSYGRHTTISRALDLR